MCVIYVSCVYLASNSINNSQTLKKKKKIPWPIVMSKIGSQFFQKFFFPFETGSHCVAPMPSNSLRRSHLLPNQRYASLCPPSAGIRVPPHCALSFFFPEICCPGLQLHDNTPTLWFTQAAMTQRPHYLT